ncbi:shikimate dehydrogenase [Deinococcus sp. KSM4-11]|uniref:shikimate dehydrogenase n=1 Tax=Deinococcus sp. KSM4-11 TaxID=2568654 RepID=UPI0010A3FF39|nr:shikimate dehydrogenase [Deinococcus sp. KSM4-11]THF88203.1 shikimate dehydrogenase [Deinococcus sp. KSM4-11]
MPAPDSPLALIGHASAAARALRDLGLVAITVPTDDLDGALSACRTLRFTGALVHPSMEAALLPLTQADPVAVRAGRVDAIAFAGGVHGTFALADALTDTIEASGYATRGASALLVGLAARDLALALPLTRLGFTDIGVVAETTPEAEGAARHLPAGVRSYPMSRRDPSVATLAERADLVVLTGGSLPTGLLQPYHTLVDLTGRAQQRSAAGTVMDLSRLPAQRLGRQLAHATGQRFHVDELTTLLPAFG